MNVYIVLKNDEPCCATLNEDEAVEVFNQKLASGACDHAAVLSVPTTGNDCHVLMEAAQ